MTSTTSRSSENLRTYRQKRDFTTTAEPDASSRSGSKTKWRYVIQKHDASRLHFDLRLELGGVLKSWAVTKGPSLNPADKRLAVRTEDHPIEYADFEGTIPEQEYGGGTVMLWDLGRWRTEDDPVTALESGKIKFTIRGKRLRGGWALIRMDDADDNGENWLLIKERDEHARDQGDVTQTYAKSVKTGRSMQQIRQGKGAAETYIGGVRLTHPDRVLFEGQGATKKDLAEYYRDVADRILPQIRNRPISLLRCPQASEDKCFFQRHPGSGMAGAVREVTVRGADGQQDYIYVDDLKGLLTLVQLGTLEFHLWGSRVDKIDAPDRMIFDLDPDESLSFKHVKRAAKDTRDLLSNLGLESFLKLTGGKGLHVVVPLARRHDWDEVKEFSKAIAHRLQQDDPDRYIATASKERRRGKVFVDYLRNAKGASAIAPYSTRAHPAAPIACPLAWRDLDRLQEPRRYRLHNIRRRLSALESDPWDGIDAIRQSLTKKAANRLSLDW